MLAWLVADLRGTGTANQETPQLSSPAHYLLSNDAGNSKGFNLSLWE